MRPRPRWSSSTTAVAGTTSATSAGKGSASSCRARTSVLLPAANRGAAETDGDVLVILNPDTVVVPGALQAARLDAREPRDRDRDGAPAAARPPGVAELRRNRRARERPRLGRSLRRAGGGAHGPRGRRGSERSGTGDPPRDVPRARRLHRRAVHVPRGRGAELARTPSWPTRRGRPFGRRLP